MITINKKKHYILIATISCFLGVCSGVAFAEEAVPSLAEKYIQQEEEKETFLDKAYNTHAETLTNILITAADDLREKNEVAPTPAEPTVTESKEPAKTEAEKPT